MKKNIKYEAPKMSVTKLESDDIIMASTLITLDRDKLMGKGKIEWIDVD